MCRSGELLGSGSCLRRDRGIGFRHEDRALKLASGTTSGYGLYVKSLPGASDAVRDGDWARRVRSLLRNDPHALGLQRLAPEDFLALDLPSENSEGLFANASLLHVPSRYLKAVLAALFATLVPGGVLFSSNPRGKGQEGWMDERYGVYHDMGCPRV